MDRYQIAKMKRVEASITWAMYAISFFSKYIFNCCYIFYFEQKTTYVVNLRKSTINAS